MIISLLVNFIKWFSTAQPGCASESLRGCLNIQMPKALLPEIPNLQLAVVYLRAPQVTVMGSQH